MEQDRPLTEAPPEAKRLGVDLGDAEELDGRYVLRRELVAMFKAQDTKIIAALVIGQGLARVPFHVGSASGTVGVIVGGALAVGGKLVLGRFV